MERPVSRQTLQEKNPVSFSWTLMDEPAPVYQWANRVVAAWDLPLLRSPMAHVALWVVIVLICAARAWVGLSGVQAFSHDAFMPLDGAWRLLNGQRPHFDFYSFIGVLAYAPTALGLLLAHGGAEGFGYAQALQSLGLGIWAYFLARKRLPDVPAVLFSLAITLLCAAPFPLGYSPLGISPATTYNRYSYAALALIMLEAFAQRKRSDFWGGVSTGSLLALLLFLKVSYFAGALLLLATLIPCRIQTLRRWFGIGSGLVALSLPFCIYYGFELLPMFRDLATVGGAKRIHLRAYLLDSIAADATAMICFGIVTAMVLFTSRRHRAARSTALGAAGVCVTSVILIFGNCEPHGLPLSLFFLLMAVSQFEFHNAGLPHLFRAVVLVWASVFTVAALSPSFLSLSYAVLSTASARHAVPLASKTLRSFTPVNTEEPYRDFVNDGFRLLKEHSTAADTVMSLDFTNPFSFGLGMKPAHGGTTALHYQTTFNDAHRPSAEWLFGAAQLVMVPKFFSDPTLQESIPRLYGPYLNSHFRLVGESAQWRLYRVVNS